MTLPLPELCLVILIGPSGSGKSTFARTHFKPTEILSSDFCRGLVSDDENSQTATNDAFDVLHYVAGKRLARGLLTVIDATNVQPESRRPLVELAFAHDVLPVAVVLKTPEEVCRERNRGRADRDFGPHVIRNQWSQLRRSLRALPREGFRYVHEVTPEQWEQVQFTRQALWNNRKQDAGPFDIIGDVHGCYEELVELLTALGYRFENTNGAGAMATLQEELDIRVQASGVAMSSVTPSDMATPPRASESASRSSGVAMAPNTSTSPPLRVTPPPGRKAIFLGDLVDRGPNTPAVLRLVMDMVAQGTALCIPGNHDVKLVRKLSGRDVQITHGLAETLAQLAGEPPEFIAQTKTFLDNLVGHYVLDGGRLVVAHAGMKEQYIGRASRRVREFALYGETTGETDEFGLPVRHNWAAEYRGDATIVYGHTPVPEADWLNRTINIDTGCVFGGKLTALRWPEREIISVPAKAVYAQPAKPFLTSELQPPPSLSAQQHHDDLLDLEDVTGKKIISTRLSHNVTVREENAIAALEVMSRFAANPKWLIYLPPTMSPTETTQEPGLLEHPREAFNYFLHQGVGQVVCEEKHMGSRAVVVICRDEDVALKRFGIAGEGIGILYTRTGRRFFDDRATEAALLAHLHAALTAASFWDEFKSDWFCLDCELMPWSAKAQDLLKHQYAAVGAAGQAALAAAIPLLAQANARYDTTGASREGSASADGTARVTKPLPISEIPSAEADPTPVHRPALDDLSDVLSSHQDRAIMVKQYIDAYRRYCWPVRSVADLRLAPFHLLASEGHVHVDQDHVWHMTALARLCIDGSPLLATRHRTIDVTDPASIAEGITWWEELTGNGGEGMVLKPRPFIVRGKRGLVQPAVKCRGREYLRIIYGPEYTAPANLSRLRSRGLAGKRSLALREFALGIESLERFVRREPLRRVHECVFGVLALESEPVDPRL